METEQLEANRPLRLTEAAALLGVHPETLRRWADTGKIPVLRTPTGERRFWRAEINHILTGSPAA